MGTHRQLYERSTVDAYNKPIVIATIDETAQHGRGGNPNCLIADGQRLPRLHDIRQRLREIDGIYRVPFGAGIAAGDIARALYCRSQLTVEHTGSSA